MDLSLSLYLSLRTHFLALVYPPNDNDVVVDRAPHRRLMTSRGDESARLRL